ncbi:8-amino-7-oxononanoate synthase [Hypnocyclicus thermotrophus]|uniref:8-amino-7-oxononanoate synthase n=1 Tax=Hypnocyclicus thermotrophus TaxID=1627895 RepID=A0AA46I4T6_9FUSO|nr:aminotransferase class I/II-fold pyridoxal phosphate-dependent enzyme [Hypnocyclicus thermotrophus]TDT67861.1 8-amino-7-oxononanoate synthase [Hypnocyclicus thermotrophus]
MNYLKEVLHNLKINNMHRELKDIDKLEHKYIYKEGIKYLDMTSSNYLGLRDDIRIKEAVIKGIQTYGVGSGASRLICGEADIFRNLEDKLAKYLKKERALIFNSGYDANIGVISTLFTSDDVIFCDKLNHASIYDGIKLSGAKLIRFKHMDYNDLREKIEKNQNYNKALIVTDSLFSMDGDIADIKQLIKIKEKYKNIYLMVDEAHAGGVFGENGFGIAERENVLEKIDINVGTFSKAYGVQGAYIAASATIIDYLINRCRSLIYTTALPPAFIAGINEAFDISIKEKERRIHLLEISKYFKESLIKTGYNVSETNSQIIPVLFKSNISTIKLGEYLLANNIYVVVIRKPTVNIPRIRFSLNSLLEKEDIDKVLELLKKYKKINY